MVDFNYDKCYKAVDWLLKKGKIDRTDHEEIDIPESSLRKIITEFKRVGLIDRHKDLNKDFIDKKVFNDEKFNRIVLSALIHERSSYEGLFAINMRNEEQIFNECNYALNYIFKCIPQKIKLISNAHYSELIDSKLIQNLNNETFIEILKYICDIDNVSDARFVKIKYTDCRELEIFMLKLFNVADKFIIYAKDKDQNEFFINTEDIKEIEPLLKQVEGRKIPLADAVDAAIHSYIESNNQLETLSLIIPMSVINFLSEKNLIENINKIEPISLMDQEGNPLLKTSLYTPKESDLYKVDMAVGKHVFHMLDSLIKNNGLFDQSEAISEKTCDDHDAEGKPLYEYFDAVELDDDIYVRYHHEIMAILLVSTYHNYFGYTEINEFLSKNKDVLNENLSVVPSISTINKFYRHINLHCFQKMLDRWIRMNEEFISSKQLIDNKLLSLLRACEKKTLTNNYRDVDIQTIIKKSGILELFRKVV